MAAAAFLVTKVSFGKTLGKRQMTNATKIAVEHEDDDRSRETFKQYY
jgi:hypothetical protein